MRTRWVLAVVAGWTALIGLLSLVPASAAGALSQADLDQDLPGGRPTYVVSLMGGPINATWVRLASYIFAPGGTVTATQWWSWNQAGISGKANTSHTKVASGYRTAGCLRDCPLRVPTGFQSGALAKTNAGRWSVNGDRLSISWSATLGEMWQLDSRRPTIVGATLIRGHSGTTYGYGFGSNAAADAGVGLDAAYATDRLIGPYAENLYGVPTRVKTAGFHFPDYSLCPSGQCMQGKGLTAASKKSWFHSYLAGNPARDGRKNYWNVQTGAQQQVEDPKGSCISARGGGHTYGMLQVLDDEGAFQGWVGVEASLSRRVRGQAVVAAFASVRPEVRAALH